jgi:hypothetical protein
VPPWCSVTSGVVVFSRLTALRTRTHRYASPARLVDGQGRRGSERNDVPAGGPDELGLGAAAAPQFLERAVDDECADEDDGGDEEQLGDCPGVAQDAPARGQSEADAGEERGEAERLRARTATP